MIITMEDETGIANVIVWPKKYEEFRRVILASNMLMVAGRMQREGNVVHLIARTIADFSPMLATVGEREDRFVMPNNRGDEFRYGEGGGRSDPRGITVKNRNFR